MSQPQLHGRTLSIADRGLSVFIILSYLDKLLGF